VRISRSGAEDKLKKEVENLQFENEIIPHFARTVVDNHHQSAIVSLSSVE